VNARDRNYTRAKLKKRMDQVEASIARYMAAMETADRQEGEQAQARSGRLKDKIVQLREQMAAFEALEPVVEAAPDQQLSLSDPDARSMATSGKGTGVVGYNVQTAVDAEHHLIVAHEVTNVGNDRGQLSRMAGEAKAAMGAQTLEVLADRGYFSGPEAGLRAAGRHAARAQAADLCEPDTGINTGMPATAWPPTAKPQKRAVPRVFSLEARPRP
jgi:transposase